MILFPNAKINIGLKVNSRRDDGYHNIESVMYPIDFTDILEIQANSDFKISYSGIEIGKEAEYISEMLLWLKKKDLINPVSVHLHKIIPVQSGLGGGSSDLAFFTKYILNSVRDKDVRDEIMAKAVDLSTDAAFFLANKPSFVYDKGDSLRPADVVLTNYHLILLFPDIEISTTLAYQNVKMNDQKIDWDLIKSPVHQWNVGLLNDFEEYFSLQYSLYDELKTELYRSGADFVSLSGTGSCIYAIYKERNPLDLNNYDLKSKWISL